MVVSVLARTIFDFAVWSPPDRRLPLLLVCEEAHRYVPREAAAAIGPARAAVERIAKEGRKYGVGLGLVTQRPSELSETALAQCNTIVALRVTNEADQAFVRRCFPDGIKSMVDALSALGNQEALIVGQAVSIPARVRFADLPVDRRPRSRNLSFSNIWQDDSFDKKFTDNVVTRWRRQDRSG